MDLRIIVRGAAYLILAAALLTTAIALDNRQYHSAEASKTEPSPTPSTLDAELARCTAIGNAAADDAACKAVWQAIRTRFFESKRRYQDRVPDAVWAKEPVSLWQGDLPNSAPPPFSPPTSSARRAGDSAGQP